MPRHGTKGQVLTRRGIDRCLGWHCLTHTEQFGIIFSIVITSIVLAVAYMYYLGKGRISRNENRLVRRNCRFRSDRNDVGPPSTITPTQITMPQHPGHQRRLVYLPMVYNYSGLRMENIITPPAQRDFEIQNQSVLARPPTAHQREHYYHQGVSHSTAGSRDLRNLQSRKPNVVGETRPREPSWWQRLHRAFRIPVGRASTIASSSPSGTPRHINSSLNTPNAERKDSISRTENQGHVSKSSRHSLEPNSVSSVKESPTPIAYFGSNTVEDTSSILSNVATVHSDDFQIPSREMPPGNLRSNNNKPIPHNKTHGSNIASVSEEHHYDTYSIPSESSLQFQSSGPSQTKYRHSQMNGSHIRKDEKTGKISIVHETPQSAERQRS